MQWHGTCRLDLKQIFYADKRPLKKQKKIKPKAKAPAHQAGEFVHDEIEENKKRRTSEHEAQKQAIAIRLSEARRSGVKLELQKMRSNHKEKSETR